MFLRNRILSAICKEAWDERAYILLGLDRHIQDIRTSRNREWWEFRRLVPTRLKDPEEGHSRPGNVSEWEDVLVLVFGTAWRTYRNSLQHREAWMKHEHEFINKVCSLWELPKLQECAPRESPNSLPFAAAAGPKRRKSMLSMDQIPSSHDDSDVQPIRVHGPDRMAALCLLLTASLWPI